MIKKWWKEGIVYQIYPRSFSDSNGDGIGDLRGIIEKLDYIEELGVNIVWLNPIYKSPNDDNGYDISNYYDIMDEFGTLKDWEELLEKLHQRGIKLIMDLVINHTSDEHSWFIESRSLKDNPYRDYYIWKQGKDFKEPNNWFSIFGGSAWEYDAKTDEYYLHLFSKKQPDLNWNNPAVRENLYQMMIWWLDKGIDGFRMDVINMISKEKGLPDINYSLNKIKKRDLNYYTNKNKVHEYLQEMHNKVLSKYDIMTVGECPATNSKQGCEYVDASHKELDMIFHFELVNLDYSPEGERWYIGKYNLNQMKKIINTWYKALYNKGWNSVYLMNHDQPRSLSRYGDDSPQYRELSGKLLATFLLTQPGTPYIYMGEEIGMTNVAFNSIKDYRDIETINYYNEAIKKGLVEEEIIKIINFRSRDNSRTPMQWDTSKNAGFSPSEPWLKVNPNYKQINVEQAKKDPGSLFYYFKELIKFRKESAILVYGDYIHLDNYHDKIYAYSRTLNKESLLILMNFSGDTSSLSTLSSFDNKDITKCHYIFGNYSPEKLTPIITLKPYEARIYKF